MNRLLLALLLLSAMIKSAPALVGQAPEADAQIARHVVLIVGSRGNFCTGAVIARDAVLTAAHCVPPGADYRIVEFVKGGAAALLKVASVRRHPQFALADLNNHRATADVAILKLAKALPAAYEPAALSQAPAPNAISGRFVVAGYGVTIRGDGKSGGTLRAAALTATGKPGSLQLRLVDPATNNSREGLGACTGDSGAPVFDEHGLTLIGLVSWSTGPNGAAGCGGLTGVTPIARYRDWILQAMR